ncbi:B-cell antigen receptor complex-associated protein beta chain [Podarcis raffonei]|uniref:B-cell antigen receptor complex-associated protein beta chain n=1 Tax=Podarcis raffonei TaxID=65483 RepID=UPI0023291626|nr:B-cell antigen receptor complex-associated protein beta chain [Podarcis raffonei]
MPPYFLRVCGVFWVMLGTCFVVTVSEKATRIRFIAARWGSQVSFRCVSSSPANWYKETEKGKHQEMVNTSRVQVLRNESLVLMHISKIQHTDNGIYFCENNKTRISRQQCCGTELRVMGISTFQQVQNRNTLKDAIIVIQTLLILLFVSVPVFLTMGKGDGKDASAEDHTYEGLAVELADTYEDICTYQDRVTDKWNLGESPGEE